MKRRRTRWRWWRLAIRVGWLRRKRHWRDSRPLTPQAVKRQEMIRVPGIYVAPPGGPVPTSIEDILDPQGKPHNGWTKLR